MAAARVMLVILLSLLATRARAAPLVTDDDDPRGVRSCSVSLHAAHTWNDSGRLETFAVLVVTVPLDRTVFSRLPPDAPNAFAALADDAAPRAETPSPASSRDQRAALPEPEPQHFVPVVTATLARATVREALRATGSGRSRSRLDSMEARAHTSAALPELRLRAARATDESMRLTPTLTDPYRYSEGGGATLLFEARLRWRLDRLVFADEELGIERLRRERAASDAKLADRVLTLLFEWQRAVAKSSDEALDPDTRAAAAMRAIESEITLDLLTSGWFTSRAPRTRDVTDDEGETAASDRARTRAAVASARPAPARTRSAVASRSTTPLESGAPAAAQTPPAAPGAPKPAAPGALKPAAAVAPKPVSAASRRTPTAPPSK